MNKSVSDFFARSWQHIVALGVFLLLTIGYFSPVFFENKTLPQSDMISYQGMGQDAREYHEQTGEFTYWSNRMFGGMPHNVTYGIPSHNVFRPIGDVLKIGLPPLSAALFWLLLLGGYVFMLSVGGKPWLSIVGAAAFALCSYNLIIIDAGHVTKALVIATMPALVGGVLLCYRERYVAGFLVTLISTGLNVYWNHQQISYYTLLMLLPLAACYGIFALKDKQMKSFCVASCLLLAAAVLAIMPAADKLLPTLDYAKETMRGGAVLQTGSEVKAEKTGLDRDYAFAWSYGKSETLTLLFPNVMGGSSHYPLGEDSETYRLLKRNTDTRTARQFVQAAPMYRGEQPFTSGPVYAGAIICFLFVLGLIVVEHRNRWWLLAAALTGILMAWGRNLPWLNNLLFDYLPLYNKFRTPAMSLVITTTAMMMLGMLALQKVLKREVKPLVILICGGGMGLICLLFALFPSLSGSFSAASDSQMPSWLLPALRADRQQMLRADAWRSLFFIASATALLWLYLKKTTMKEWIAVMVTGILIVADLWMVDKHFLNNSHFVRERDVTILPTANNRQILQDTDPDYRVLNLTSNTFNESQTSYFHNSIGGYSPAKLRRYQDIIDRYLNGRINPDVLDMLNTRYVITRDGVRYNHQALGNAWWVNEVQWVNNPNEEIEAIGSADLRHVAVVDTCWRSAIGIQINPPAANATVELTRYANPGQLFYACDNSEDGLIVFSEIYYKTWQAYIDGQRADLLRADYLLRALPVPAGNHQIELRCVDELYEKTHRWSLWASILAVLAAGIAIGIGIWYRKKYPTEQC